jgi:hypothetical protein
MEMRVRDVFTLCANLESLDPAVERHPLAARLLKVDGWMKRALACLEPVLLLVDKNDDDSGWRPDDAGWVLYHSVNAQFPPAERSLDRVRLLTSFLSIRRRCGGSEAESQSSEVQTLADVLVLFFRLRLRFERASDEVKRTTGTFHWWQLDREVERAASYVVDFLYAALGSCQMLHSADDGRLTLQ